ncbi:MAG: hypothetical protein ACOCXJ_02625, partial [Planctomycetota bacterium]
MKILLIPGILLLVAFLLGLIFRQDPYQLRDRGRPYDQAALAHRDSPYSHITWVASTIGNYAQLRFFDKIEGGVCLQPSWAQLIDLAAADPALAHLVPGPDWDYVPEPGRTWPEDRPHPDPGTLSNTKYTCLYPSAVLLNEGLMQAAGGDYRKAAPNILIIGLGSGIGIALYAHHFPEASITVVDIDRVVNEKALRYAGGEYDGEVICRDYDWQDETSHKPHTIASAIDIAKPVNINKCLRALEICDGVV